MKEKTLKERVGMYARLTENQDFKDVIEEQLKEFGVNQSVFLVCNCPNPSEYLFAREAIRTFVNKILSMEEELTETIEQEEKGEEE